MSLVKENLFNALKLRYQAEIQECRATLMVYFNNSVGIGEHPQQLEEMDKLLEKMTHAQDKLQMLENEKENFC